MRKLLILSPLVLALACGGGGGGSGPTGPSQFPSIAGPWFVNQVRLGGTCPLVEIGPFTGIITQSGSQIQMLIGGSVNYFGSIQENGDFTMTQATVDAGLGLRSDSTVSGRFSGGSVAATENETITALQDGSSCTFVWQWTGNM